MAGAAAAGLTLVLAATRLRFSWPRRRFRFSTLLYCLPIKCLYFANSIRLLTIMKIRLARFNTYLLLLFLGILALGCQSGKAEKKAPKKGYSLLRLHL